MAQDVSLVGVIGNRVAVLVIDGAQPRSLRVGQRAGGVSVVSIDGDRATIEANGLRRVLILGQRQGVGAARGGDRQSAVLAADARGHFVAEGSINGGHTRFLVDTGATSVALPARDARRLGLDYRRGARGNTLTANGPAPFYAIKLDTVKVGDIELHNVDAIVLEGGLEIALLGMSFLNRLEMQREGTTLTLTRRY